MLLTDIVMPGINGVALAKLLQAMRPNMKVLYTSGYGDTALEDRGVTANLPVLAKPCDAEELSKHVQPALVRGDEAVKYPRQHSDEIYRHAERSVFSVSIA